MLAVDVLYKLLSHEVEERRLYWVQMIHVDRYRGREAHEVHVRAVGVEDCGGCMLAVDVLYKLLSHEVEERRLYWVQIIHVDRDCSREAHEVHVRRLCRIGTVI